MTLHTGLANPTCLQSCRVQSSSVCELRESNQRRRRILGPIGIFYLTLFPWTYLHDFLVSGVI